MPSSSRRNFIAMAGAGAAGVGLSTAIGLTGSETLGLARPAKAEVPLAVPASFSGSLVAYIDDVHGDELSLMIGDDEVVLKDPALIARIAGAVAHSKVTSSV